MKTLLIALLLLVFATGRALAECAWVLWNEQSLLSETTPMQKIVPQESYKDQDECVRVKDEQIRKSDFAAMFPAAKIVKTIDSIMITGPKGLITYTYRCLPDTVDPRGPKGGLR